MKMFKIAAASAVLALASGYAAAASMAVTASSPTAIAFSVSSMAMPMLTEPSPTNTSSVTIFANGDNPLYEGEGAYGNPNITSDPGTPGVISITVGQANHVVFVEATDTSTETGAALDQFNFHSGITSGAVSGDKFTLNTTGTLNIDVGARLTIDDTASLPTTPSLSANITVVYAAP